MKRTSTSLGISVALVFAIFAVSAQAAFASSALTVGNAASAWLHADQTTTQKLVLGGGTVSTKCTTSTKIATTTGSTVTDATFTPTLSGCTFGGVTATVDLHSCQTTMQSTATALTWTMSIVNCPSTSPIEITVTSTGCVIKISNQGPLNKITVANVVVSPSHVNTTLAVTGIAYQGNVSCPSSIIGAHSDGELSGGFTMKAYVDEGGKKGPQISLTGD